MGSPTEVHAKRHFVLLACMCAMFMAAIEVTIVATALPTIIADLGGFSLLGWVFSAYLLTQSVTIPIYGRLADLYGRKKIFFIGCTLFLIGSSLCGFAPDMLWLILFRALQGIGAGGITPIASTVIADVYSAHERPKVQGYLSSVWGISAIIGPLAGAFIVHHFHWSLVFWLNIPIGLFAMYLLLRFFPEERRIKKHNLDLPGTAYLTVGVSTLLIALLQAEELGYWTIPLLLLAALAGYLLVKQERVAPEPLFPLILWRSKIILMGNIGGLVMGIAMMGISAFLPTFVQAVMGKGPLEAGMTLAMMSIGWPLASAASGRLMQLTSYRCTAIGGGFLLIAGCCVLLLLNAESDLLLGRLAAFMIGAGLGLSNTTFLVSIQNAAPFEYRGIATASTMFTRQLGGALGTAIMGATLNLSLQYYLPTISDPVQILMDPQQRNTMLSERLSSLILGVENSLHLVFIMTAIISLCVLLAAWYIPSRKEEEQGKGKSVEDHLSE